MTIQDAKKNLQGLINTCLSKGGIFNNTTEVMAMQMSLNILFDKANGSEQLKTNSGDENTTEQS